MASLALAALALLQAQAAFECVGQGVSDGYPFGKQAMGETRYLLASDGEQLSVRGFCLKDAACTSKVAAPWLELQVRADRPPYYQTFKFDRQGLRFEASGGGLDGGWRLNGKCRQVAMTAFTE